MANPTHIEILKQGVQEWNEWRGNNHGIDVDLTNANLTNLDLYGVNFAHCNLNGANLREVRLSSGYFVATSFVEADLSNADIHGTLLNSADFTRAKLVKTNFGQCNLTKTNFTEANLAEARFVETMMIMTNFEGANLDGCDVYGISAWELNLIGSNQRNLRITRWNEPLVTVDNIEVAQFVYLLLRNEKIRDIIDTLTTKSVLILGRFTSERKAVLDAIRDELRRHDYVPILFEFDKPENRDLTETIMTLAGLSRFVIADLSDPHSIPHELMSFAEKLLSVPVQLIFSPVPEHPQEYPMIEHLMRYPHILPIYQYQTSDQLVTLLTKKVIEPAEAKVAEMRQK